MPGNKPVSILRLIYGGVALATEELLVRLKIWDDESIPPKNEQTNNEDNITATTTRIRPAKDNTSSSTLRHALYGLALEFQNSIHVSRRRVTNLERSIVQAARPIVQPISSSRIVQPAKRQFNRFVDRGQMEVNRLVTNGRMEEERNKSIARIAYQSSVNEVIEDLAENPEVQLLVQTQATGLVAEVIEEIRERSVSGDIFLEGLVRYALRKRPRAEIPPPPQDVQAHAQSFRLHQVK